MRPETLVGDHTIYACVMGSRAFGLATEASDTDRRGVFLAPTRLFWRFEKPPTHVEGPAEEQFSWELERFCELALRANPSILECLHSPLVEYADATGRELLSLRGALSPQGPRDVHAVRPRPAPQAGSRCPLPRRPALEGRHASAASPDQRPRPPAHGRPHDRRGRGSELLLAVKRGEVPWPEVESRMARLAEEGAEAARRSPLPEELDRRRVEDFLVRTRRASALRTDPSDEVVRGDRSGVPERAQFQ